MWKEVAYSEVKRSKTKQTNKTKKWLRIDKDDNGSNNNNDIMTS